MHTTYWQPLVQTTAINSIRTYQKYISPRKGFACPHRLLHGGDSCSDYVKNALTQQNLTTVVNLSWQRFRDCHQASRNLASRNTTNGFRCIVIPCCVPF